MSEPTEKEKPARGEPEVVLRAKYHDYCSAQVADTLLLLSPDEIFVMAQEEAEASGVEAELSYDRAVQLATARVFHQLALPSFETWLADYRAHPDRYARYFMGLWQSEADET